MIQQPNRYAAAPRRRRRTRPLLLLLTLAVTSACGIGVDDATRLENARQYVADGDLRAAVIELKNVLRSDPNNAQARLLLGEAAAAMGDMPAAEKELLRARELGVPGATVVVTLARSLLYQNKHQQVLDDIDPAIAETPADRAELIALRGSAWLGADSPQRAAEAFAEALSVDATSETALLGKAELARRAEDDAAAVRFIEEALEHDPESVAALSALGRAQLEGSQFTAAQATFKKAESVADGKATAQQLFVILAGRDSANPLPPTRVLYPG